jgi:hypothetical protein
MSPALDVRSREFRLAAACVAVSIGLHAAFLLGSRMGEFQTAASNAPATVGVEVRLKAAAAQAPDTTVSDRSASAESQWRPLQPMPKRSVNTHQFPAMLEFRPVDLPPRAFDEKPYAALAALTRVPSPVRPVAVPYPEGTPVTGTVTARLTLFIDEAGNVARVVVGNAELPDAFVQAAKDAFEPAKFRPGEIDGTPVKVRMVVDVEFEDRGERRPKRNRPKPS